MSDGSVVPVVRSNNPRAAADGLGRAMLFGLAVTGCAVLALGAAEAGPAGVGAIQNPQSAQLHFTQAPKEKQSADKLPGASEAEYQNRLKEAQAALDAALRAKEVAAQELEAERVRAQVIQQQLDDASEKLASQPTESTKGDADALQLRAAMAQLSDALLSATQAAEIARSQLAAAQVTEKGLRERLRTSVREMAELRARVSELEAEQEAAKARTAKDAEAARTALAADRANALKPRDKPRAGERGPADAPATVSAIETKKDAAKLRAEQEAATRLATAQKAEAERQRQAAEAAEKAEAERQRQAAEAARKAEAERQREAAEAAKKAEAERQRQAAEAAKKAEAERQRQAAEAARKAEAERQRQAAEAAQKAEAEHQRQAAEAVQKAEAERQRQAAEAAQKAEAERQRQAAEAAQKAEAERQRQLAAAAAAAEAARMAEAERQRMAVEAAQKAEAERLRLATAEAARIAKEVADAKARADQETRRRTLGLTVTPEDGARYLARGRALLTTGDVTSARLFLERASNAGLADAAMELAETYDPATVKTRFNIVGLAADRELARTWYTRAQALGSSAAAERLKSIGAQ